MCSSDLLDDGLTPVLAAVAACDVLVLATPVYFGEVTAQLKTFIDRTFSFLTPDYARNKDKRSRLTPGKTLVMLLAQGHPREDLFADIFPRYQYFYNWMGFTQSHLVRACGIYHPGTPRPGTDSWRRSRPWPAASPRPREVGDDPEYPHGARSHLPCIRGSSDGKAGPAGGTGPGAAAGPAARGRPRLSLRLRRTLCIGRRLC